MPPVFQPRTNLIARGSLFVLAAVLVVVVTVWVGFTGSAYDTGETLALWQPVPFSHEHHAGELGIDCRYCHTSVDTSSAAGMPSSDVCMNCHREIWTEADILAPIRESWREGERMRWKRVFETPDFVYFEHAVHVRAGVSCEVCHGPVDRMPLVYEAVEHTMEWCLDCHRDPWPRLGTRPLLTATTRRPSEDPARATRDLAASVSTAGLTSCSTCHR